MFVGVPECHQGQPSAAQPTNLGYSSVLELPENSVRSALCLVHPWSKQCHSPAAEGDTRFGRMVKSSTFNTIIRKAPDNSTAEIRRCR
eukprot:5941994-Amphidinium_carterae.2